MDKIANSLNPFNSNFFIYIDAGSFREKMYPYWPNEEFINKLKLRLKDKMLLGQINPFNALDYSPNKDYIEGGFFAG